MSREQQTDHLAGVRVQRDGHGDRAWSQGREKQADEAIPGSAVPVRTSAVPAHRHAGRRGSLQLPKGDGRTRVLRTVARIRYGVAFTFYRSLIIDNY